MVFMSKKQQQASRRSVNHLPDRRLRSTSAELDTKYSFRRNRTLTGSLASGVASANEQAAELKSSRVQSHHLRRHRRRAFSALLAVGVGGLLLAFLLSQSIMTIRATSSAKNPDLAMYEQKIHDYLLRRPMERFRFSLNTQALTTYLQAQNMPEVESVASDIKPNGLGKAILELTFRKPVVAWQTAGVKLYVDALGNSFQRNYLPEPAVQVVDQTGIQSQNNQVLASNRFLGFIGKVVGRMKDNGLTVTELILPANTTRQVQVRIQDVPYLVKFSVDRPAGEQAEDAARSVKYISQQGMSPEYLDVRVSGKAFYR